MCLRPRYTFLIAASVSCFITEYNPSLTAGAGIKYFVHYSGEKEGKNYYLLSATCKLNWFQVAGSGGQVTFIR
jgi:hypothetical protein